jgi:hypothetical protein
LFSSGRAGIGSGIDVILAAWDGNATAPLICRKRDLILPPRRAKTAPMNTHFPPMGRLSDV